MEIRIYKDKTNEFSVAAKVKVKSRAYSLVCELQDRESERQEWVIV